MIHASWDISQVFHHLLQSRLYRNSVPEVPTFPCKTSCGCLLELHHICPLCQSTSILWTFTLSPERSSSCGRCLQTYPYPVAWVRCLLKGHHPMNTACWPTTGLCIMCPVIILWTLPPDLTPACDLRMPSPVWSSSCGRCLLTHPKPVTCECCLVCGHHPVARVRPDLPSACAPCMLSPELPSACDLWMPSPVWSSPGG